MAQIKLSLSDLGAASQLDRCMCCGEKASVRCDKSFVVWWWALGQSRWCYITAVGVAILAMNYSLDGLWKWSALAALFCSVAFIVRLMARRSWNQYLIVSTPLCDEHKDYWTRYEWWQQKAVPWLQGGVVVTICCVVAALHLIEPVAQISAVLWGDDLVLFILLSVAIPFGFEVALALVAIHPVAITSQTVTLAAVSEKFVEVVTGQRRMLAQTDWIDE